MFDCDGVLFESRRANVEFYTEVLRRCGEPPLPDSGEGGAHELSSTDLFARYYGDRPELLERVRKTASTLDYGPFYEFMEPRENLRAILAELATRHRLAMATNRGKTTHEVLARFGLTDCFDLAVGAHDVERPKPYGDMLELCMEHFGAGPDESVYVGDQMGDWKAADAAGVAFVGMGEAVSAAPRTIERLDELAGHLTELGREACA